MPSTDFTLYAWIILPLLIFTARVADVSLGTVRFIMVARGYKYIAPWIGFIEILIWIVAIGQIMQNLSNWVCYVAYAAGFATGNFVGMWLAEKIPLGTIIVRVVTQRDALNLLTALRQADYGVTSLVGEGSQGPVQILFTVISRRKLSDVIQLVQKHNPLAFYTIEDVDKASHGVFPKSRINGLSGAFPALRKGK